MIPKRYENASYDDVPQDIKKAFEKIRETRKGLYIHGGVGTGKTHIAYALHKKWEEDREKEIKKRNDTQENYRNFKNEKEDKIKEEEGVNKEYTNYGEYSERRKKSMERIENEILSFEKWLKQEKTSEPIKTRPISNFVGITKLFTLMRGQMNDPNKNEKDKLHNRMMESEKLYFIDDLGTEKTTEWVSEMFYMIINQKYEDEIPMIFTSNYSLGQIAGKSGVRIVSRIREMCDVFEIKGEDKRIK